MATTANVNASAPSGGGDFAAAGYHHSAPQPHAASSSSTPSSSPSSPSPSSPPPPAAPPHHHRPSMDTYGRASFSVEPATPTAAAGGSGPNASVNVNASNASNAAASAAAAAAGAALAPAPTTFDEATLRALCDTDVGIPLLYERIKQSMTSCREAAAFFKKRAAVEDEYGRSMQKLYKTSLESYGSADGKAGTYVSSWHTILATHESLADSRVRLAARLTEMSDELMNLVKEVDRNRKSARETGQRLERALLDAEGSVEKSRSRFDAAAEDLERLLLLKSGESTKQGDLAASHPGRSLGKAMSKGGMLFTKNKNPQQLLRQEEEIRARTSQLSDHFRREVLQTQQMRQEYFNLQLPRVLRSLKETAEEIDNGLQYHLSRYAFLYESTILSDGMTVTPVGASAQDGIGLKQAAEAIDNRGDFKTFMQNYHVLHGASYRGPRRQGPWEEGFVSSDGNAAASTTLSPQQSSTAPTSHSHAAATSPALAASSSSLSSSPRPIFGVDLATQMARDNVEVPGILTKCAAAVEALGCENMGIYRLSGTTSKVQRLKHKFDADWTSLDVMADAEATSDINIVAGCLKLWFRELPEPLLTHELYRAFIDAARIDNERLRHIRLHEVVNQLPDANYSTLKALMGHLDRIRSDESLNQMGASNLAIVFGPTLLNPPTTGTLSEDDPAGGGAGTAPHSDDTAAAAAAPSSSSSSALQDMQYQAKAVETILVHYRDIFLEDDEIEAAQREDEERRRERGG